METQFMIGTLFQW